MPESNLSYVYNPETGKWTRTGSTSSSKDVGTDNLNSTDSDSNSSTGSVEQKYNNIEINTLSGTLSYIVTEETIKLKAGDTVRIQGIGKYLSGDYYVKDVARNVGSNGYSHSATLIRTDFGNSLKTTTKVTNKSIASTPKTQEAVTSNPPAVSAQRTHTVSKGECLWGIAKKYYGNGALYPKIREANSIPNSNLILVGQVLIIP